MGYVILKPDPTEDFYLVWSTYVDSWTFAGTRAELERESGINTSPDRFDRADAFGTSSHVRVKGYQTQAHFQNHGTVKYSDLKELVDIMWNDYLVTGVEMKPSDPRIAHLIEPFEE